MKILHTVAPASVGGLEEVVIRLTVGLRGRGHDASVAAVLDSPARAHPFVQALEEEGVPVHPVVVGPRRYRKERREVAELLRTSGTEILHTHGYRPDVLHQNPAKRFGIPAVTTLHGFTGGGLKNRTYERLQIRAVRSFDAVVAVSAPMATLLQERGVPAARIHRIPNAWRSRHAPATREEARRALGVPADRFHVGWVGRLSREKGVDVFLDALARLSDADLTASILGDGPMTDEVKRAVSARLGERDVRVHGAVPGAARLFSAFDLFVLSSRTEGTPIVLFEAMAACVPVVATAVGGVPDVVTARTGILVPSEDPDALAAAMATVRTEPKAARERAGRAARRATEVYALDPWIDRYEALYRALLETPPPQL